MCIRNDLPSQRGVTLIELIMFIVIVSAALAGVLTVLDFSVRTSANPLVNKQAMAVADAMMEEILLKDFANPVGGWAGLATVANRPLFDDIGDYNGYASTGVFAITDTANPIAALNDYNVAVTVAPPTAAIGGVVVADIRQIVVTVTRGALTYTLTGYRFNP
ncbi:MAG TPA: type II secretion system protein [Rhodocyclaceae bacterium]|nr:type II secretion system protein [Rhodocyclaceae bacterium]